MRVPSDLSTSFGASFESLISEFALRNSLIPEGSSLGSQRFVARSIVPHVKKLSSLFNREERDQSLALAPYWKESSHPAHLRAAYFFYFMPCNLYRIAAVWAELGRLGWRWSAGATLRAIELGAGPAAGASATAIAERMGALGIPRSGDWALIEQDQAMLELGKLWAETYFTAQGMTDWGTRPFHRKLRIQDGFLPRTAPKFNVWIMSFFLNELADSPAEIAAELVRAWEHHLEDEGVVILVEPALKLQSRKLLEIRRELLALRARRGLDWLQVLLPCLGSQSCGALSSPEDWCHEEVSWWRPPYFRLIDKLAGLDRKTLPFSYLVLAKSRRKREELLPALAGSGTLHRLVSPAHAEGRELEFFLCGQEGKRRARYRPTEGDLASPAFGLERGDILSDAQIRGDTNASRVERIAAVK